MTYEEKFKFLASNQEFKLLAADLRKKWLIGRKGYRTIFDINKQFIFQWNHLRKYYPDRYVRWLENNGCKAFKMERGRIRQLNHNDWLEFWGDLKSAIAKFNLPYRCDEMLYDFLKNNKIKESYPKIRLEMIFDGQVNGSPEVMLYVSPDARFADVKKYWKEVAKLQKDMLRGDIKTQKIRNHTLIDLLLNDKKRDNMLITEAILGKDYYLLPGSVKSGPMHEAIKKARRRANTYTSRYKKKINNHVS